MKKGKFSFSTACVLMASLAILGCSKNAELNNPSPSALATNQLNSLKLAGTTGISGPYKVAYYAFDNGGPRLSQFAPDANVVVLFEGTVWAMADTIHYPFSGNYISSNTNYKSYKALLADVRTLQSKGVKVLYNVDDDPTWQTTTVLPTGNRGWLGSPLSATQFASLIKVSAIDSLHLDGIALDQEHITPWSTTPNTNYLAVLNALSSYFGLTSSNPSTIFTTATGSNVAYGINPVKQNTAYAANMNFAMDQSYNLTNSNRVNTRVAPWANITGFGWPKTMMGVITGSGVGSSQFQQDILSAKWQPSSGSHKAGLMVYAANADTAYAGQVLRAITP